VKRLFVRSQRKSVAPDEATVVIRELAESQHGVVARRQLLALSVGSELIRDRVNSGRLLRLHQGVFAVGHRRIGLHGRWMAAVLACGPNAYLSHGSAAQMWGLRGTRPPYEVIRTAGHRRPHGVRLHQTRSLPEEDVTMESGIPVTTVERTLSDIAGRHDARQMEHALVAADRSRRLNWEELERVLEQSKGRKGRARLRRVAARVDPRAADAVSPLEVDFLALCQRADLPLPQVNVVVMDRVVDFLWPDAKVIVETDGYAFHGDRRSFERDRESTVMLTAAGYAVHRMTYRMLKSNPEPVLRLLRSALRP
jgi:predicted transcriptional regulator of viral defense system